MRKFYRRHYATIAVAASVTAGVIAALMHYHGHPTGSVAGTGTFYHG